MKEGCRTPVLGVCRTPSWTTEPWRTDCTMSGTKGSERRHCRKSSRPRRPCTKRALAPDAGQRVLAAHPAALWSNKWGMCKAKAEVSCGQRRKKKGMNRSVSGVTREGLVGRGRWVGELGVWGGQRGWVSGGSAGMGVCVWGGGGEGELVGWGGGEGGRVNGGDWCDGGGGGLERVGGEGIRGRWSLGSNEFYGSHRKGLFV